MNNNKESDYEIINRIVESITQEQSGEDEDNKDYELLEILEAIKNNADEHLKKIKLDKINNQFKLIKETTNEVLIATISKKYSSISQDQKEIEENVVIIKQHTLDELLNLSFKTFYKALATMLALVIEQFKEDSKERRLRAEKVKAKGNKVEKNQAKEKPVKLLVATQKAILILMVANEIKSIVREWKDIIKDKEDLLIDDYLIDFMEDIKRIGYLEGLLDSESRLANYHHRLIAGVHSKSSNKDISEFANKIRPVIENTVKQLYAEGSKDYHNDLAKNMRNVISKFLKRRREENITKKKSKSPVNKVIDTKYKEIIDFLDQYSANNKTEWDKLIKLFRQRSSKTTSDFLLNIVRYSCPDERRHGVKKEPKIS